MAFVENLQEACKLQGIKITPLLQELGMSTGNLGKWKRGAVVSSDTLIAISDRLGVSIDFLLKGGDAGKAFRTVSEDENRLLGRYRRLTDSQKQLADVYVSALADAASLQERLSS